MKNPPVMERTSAHFERTTIIVLQIFLIIVLALAMYELAALLYRVIAALLTGEATPATTINGVPALQRSVQRAFAGVLLIILGLELLETLRTYFSEHRVRLEVIMIVAIIAAGRHIIQLDFEQLDSVRLIGIGAVVLSLSAGYYLIRRSGALGQSDEGDKAKR
jgi:uncharacterized membrane protein (DUF373 family)